MADVSSAPDIKKKVFLTVIGGSARNRFVGQTFADKYALNGALFYETLRYLITRIYRSWSDLVLRVSNNQIYPFSH